MDSLENINTVEDLLSIQTTDHNKKVKAILKRIYKLEPDDGKTIALDIIASLINLHHTTVDTLIDENMATDASTWGFDEGKLTVAYQILKDINV